MKSSTKDRLKLLIIFGFLLLIISVFIYFTFINPVVATYLAETKLVDMKNEEDINMYKKYKTCYSYKVNENDKFLLKYNYYIGEELVTEAFTLTSDQYDELIEGEYYWLKVKDSDDDEKLGIVKKVYTNNPRTR